MLACAWAITLATLETDENGERRASTDVPAYIGAAGVITFVIPLTPYVNFIWNSLPKRSLDAYNRNRKTAP